MNKTIDNDKPAARHNRRLLLLLLAVCLAQPQAGFADAKSGKVTAPLKPEVPYVFVVHQGRSIKVERDLDQSFRARIGIRGTLMQTSTACPPFCLQAITLDVPVASVAEAEIVDFMLTTMRDNNGILIDVRHPKQFKTATIPGSINLFIQDLMKAQEDGTMDAALERLGAKRREQPGWLTRQLEAYGLIGNDLRTDSWDFTDASELIVWATSATDNTSAKVIHMLLSAGYPASKLKWYRGGMAAWQYWGFNTVRAAKR